MQATGKKPGFYSLSWVSSCFFQVRCAYVRGTQSHTPSALVSILVTMLLYRDFCTCCGAATPVARAALLDETPYYKNGAVASEVDICSTIGMRVMRDKHGNAVDAAIASLICVGVINSFSSGIGGSAWRRCRALSIQVDVCVCAYNRGGFMLVRNQAAVPADPVSWHHTVIDFREMAPENIRPDDFGVNTPDRSSSTYTATSVAVPYTCARTRALVSHVRPRGEIKGMHTAHQM